MPICTRVGVGVLVVASVAVATAQPPSRLKGRVLTPTGQPVANADVRVEAIAGFRGEGYPGQRTYALRSDGKGEWALIGFKSGIWVFDAVGPGQLPDAIALPINASMAQSSGVGGDTPNWHPILRPTDPPHSDAGELLVEAADAARLGERQAVVGLLSRVADSNDPTVLIAAGRICLLLRDATIARPFFRRALEREPRAFGAALGMGSTALMQQDFDAAARSFGDARTMTTDKDERSYLTAAIADLSKVQITWKRTG